MLTAIMNELEIKEVSASDQEWISYYQKWENDIQSFFPHFSEDEATFSQILMLNYRGETAGVFVYQDKGDELHIDLDYVSPDFRNLGIGGDFFQQKKDDFQRAGFKKIVTLTNNKDHRDYVLSIGFESSSLHPDLYVMELNRDHIQ
jgi:predicted GNAT family acetyltransferase